MLINQKFNNNISFIQNFTFYSTLLAYFELKFVLFLLRKSNRSINCIIFCNWLFFKKQLKLQCRIEHLTVIVFGFGEILGMVTIQLKIKIWNWNWKYIALWFFDILYIFCGSLYKVCRICFRVMVFIIYYTSHNNSNAIFNKIKCIPVESLFDSTELDEDNCKCSYETQKNFYEMR